MKNIFTILIISLLLIMIGIDYIKQTIDFMTVIYVVNFWGFGIYTKLSIKD